MISKNFLFIILCITISHAQAMQRSNAWTKKNPNILTRIAQTNSVEQTIDTCGRCKQVLAAGVIHACATKYCCICHKIYFAVKKHECRK